MDKNMINIDELFRHRMSGREEPERAGAWSRMSDLLDKNEQTKPVGFAWKRFAGVVAGLVMVSAVSVGGYKMLGHKEHTASDELNSTTAGILPDNAAAHNTAATSSNGANHDHGSDNNHYANNNSSANTDNDRNSTANTTNTTGYSSTATKPAGSQHASYAHNAANSLVKSGTNVVANHQQNVSGAHKTPAGNHGAAHHNTHNNVTAGKAGNNVMTVVAGNNKANADNDIAMAATDQNNSNVINSNATTGAVATTVTGKPAMITATGNSTVITKAKNKLPRIVANRTRTTTNHNRQLQNTGKADGMTNNSVAAASVNAASTGNKAQKGNKTGKHGKGSTMQQLPLAAAKPATAAKQVSPYTSAGVAGNNVAIAQDNTLTRKDTIAKVTITQHIVVDPYSRKKYIVVDTQSIENILVERTMPFAMSVAPQILPGASMYTAPSPAAVADAGDNIVPLSNYKVEGKKKKWNPEIFAEVFENAKTNIANAKMFPGLSAGINSFFTQGMTPGLHFGINNEIVFNDRWSIMTELKYLTNFNNGKNVTDDYITGPNAVYTVNNNGTPVGTMYERDSVKHYFKFSGYGSLYLPISVRYSVKRLFFGAGVNFVYNFGVNTEEKTESYTIKEMVPLDKTAPDYLTRIGSAKIATGDFSSRFGIGYLFNAGYNISPAFSADLRFMQTFWDNAGSTGAGRVSQQIFKAPGMQFSINYRFGQNSH